MLQPGYASAAGCGGGRGHGAVRSVSLQSASSMVEAVAQQLQQKAGVWSALDIWGTDSGVPEPRYQLCGWHWPHLLA